MNHKREQSQSEKDLNTHQIVNLEFTISSEESASSSIREHSLMQIQQPLLQPIRHKDQSDSEDMEHKDHKTKS